MKKRISLIALFICAAAVLAQTLTPVSVDYRYRFFWDEPNPPGTIVSYRVSVLSNNIAIRTAHTRLQYLDVSTVLEGLQAGVWTNTFIGTDTNGAETEISTFTVEWPGGKGRRKGPTNIRSTK